jgi:hypothetical protein
VKLATFLLSMCEPLVAKILLGLGFSVVSIVGMEAIIETVKGSFVTGLQGLPVDMLNVFQLAGGNLALGMIFGAMTTKVTLWGIQSATSMLGKAPT